MRKTKLERIAAIEQQMGQLEIQRKQLQAQHREEDRKKRTKRLIERGAILESLIPDAEILSNEQVKSFLEKTVSSGYAVKILDGMRQQTPAPTTPKTEETQEEES